MKPMAMAVNKYEEARRQMLEENKKRMQELGLLDLTESLKPPLPASRPVKVREWTPRAPSLPSRRSARTAGKPVKSYKEEIPMDRYIAASAADIAVMESVDEALAKLTNPAFVRTVLYSYGAGASQGYIPCEFRRNYMPESDEWFTLEDEDQLEWSILYNTEFGDLRKGWRDFSCHHELMAGDICVFELVRPLRFKVQIFRYNQYHKGPRRTLNSDRKKVASKEPQMQKTSSERNGAVPEDDHVLVDRKPKLEAQPLEAFQSANGREARLPNLLDRKPKLEEDIHGGAGWEAGLSFRLEKKPKLEPELLADCQNTDTRVTRSFSPNNARHLRSALDNPD